MSREIKFRFWDTKEGKWLGKDSSYWKELTFDDCRNKLIASIRQGNIVAEQYTGLKDKNDEEIYEGDIVDYVDECTCVVQYEDEGARFIHRDVSDDFPFGFNGLGEYNGKLFEVIGNIHENPKLLEGEK